MAQFEVVRVGPTTCEVRLPARVSLDQADQLARGLVRLPCYRQHDAMFSEDGAVFRVEFDQVGAGQDDDDTFHALFAAPQLELLAHQVAVNA